MSGLLGTAEKLSGHDQVLMVRTSGTSPVCLVHLVNLMQPNKLDRPNRPNEQDRLADFFSILLRCAACNLTIVGLQHDRAGWFNKRQLALIQGVGAIQIDPLLCLTEFDM